MIFYKGAVASSPSKSKRFNEDNFFFNSKVITGELSASQILLSHKKEQKGIQIYAVMDGAGSESYEDSASLVVAEKLREYYDAIVGAQDNQKLSDNDIKRYLDSFVNSADKAVKQKVQELLGMRVSSTLGLVCINGTHIMAMNVGDTKIFRLRDGKIEQISIDDTQAQRMIDKGVASPDRIKSSLKKNKLTQYLGILPDGEVLNPHCFSLESKHADMFLICSSSICNSIKEERLADVIAGKNTPADVVDTIMSEAIDCNVKEDATIMAIQAIDSEIMGAEVAQIPVVASGLKKSWAKKERLYDNKENTTESAGTTADKKPAEKDTKANETENKYLIPVVIIGVILILILLLIFGIKAFKSSRESNLPSPTATVEPGDTAEPSGEPSSEPTRIPTATPTPGDRTPEPTNTNEPTQTPAPTSVPTATPTLVPGETPIPVEYIIVNKTNEELDLNETLQITVTFYPSNATDKSVKWKSSNSDVASVDDKGLITALKEGTANITVTPKDAASKTIVITVVATRPDSVELDITEKSAMVNDEFDLTYTVNPEKAYFENAVWTSTDETVATVDENGHVVAVGNGTATIKLTLEDGTSSPVFAECTVTVTSIVNVESVTLDKKELTLVIGETYTLIADLLPLDATNRNITWSSDCEDFVTVDIDGKVTAVAAGNAVITVTTEDGSYTDSCEVIVTEPVKPASIELDNTELEITVGFDGQINATVLPEDAADKSLTWSSSDETVATVDETGKVTAVSAGTAIITVKANADETVTAECSVTVVAAIDVENIELEKTELTISIGEKVKKPKATITPDNATYQDLSWTIDPECDNPEAITFDGNFIEAVSAGNAVVIVSDITGTVTATITVTVTAE